MASTFSRIISTLIVLLIPIYQAPSYAQTVQNTQLPPLLSTAEIEQLVAPVALYPDALLAQVLMAATYPIQVVDAARWRAIQAKNLSDQQLSALTQDKPWDPSVKSLTAFPSVLDMMDDNLDWTGELGNAFLDQQQDVMDAVQRLRTQAHAAGNLQSGPQQTVYASGDPPIIVIQPTHPDTVYVPVYNPSVVYGVWAYPSYPPYYWQPPSYSPGGTILGFTAGLLVGNALWGSVDWHRHDVTINVNRYNTYNHTHITSNRWQRPPQSSRWRAADYRRNPGQRSLSGPGAGDQRTNSQRPNRPNARPGSTRSHATTEPSTRPRTGEGGERRNSTRPNTQLEQPRTRPGAADQRPNLPNARPGSTRSNAIIDSSSSPRTGERRNNARPNTQLEQPRTRPGAADQRPNLPNARPGSTRSNAIIDSSSSPRTGERRNSTRPNTQLEQPRTRSGAAGQRPNLPNARPDITGEQRGASDRPDIPRPAATQQRPNTPRPAASKQRPDTPRPVAAPQRPNIQRPAAAPRPQAASRPTAAPERPNIQRPSAAPPRTQRPAAAPARPSTQRPSAARERPSAPRPAASSERRDSPRAASSGKRRGDRE